MSFSRTFFIRDRYRCFSRVAVTARGICREQIRRKLKRRQVGVGLLGTGTKNKGQVPGFANTMRNKVYFFRDRYRRFRKYDAEQFAESKERPVFIPTSSGTFGSIAATGQSC